ncbi:glycosyltransferase [Rivibacter subsaxonicus]|uniref:Glycosyl transferase family 2 n=1 Tax=Rivibacter subsaxonicus TaxID=457575 RepID=A0A4Q7VZR3_9BURK|nr:glycosyltransferase [Rivibacter subsaxonicus]RZU02404.1 glycosyl transferase family 2 [Rivibacter subsaxonicus]
MSPTPTSSQLEARLPSVTVVIVSDERSVDRSWQNETKAIEAFATQDYRGAIDILLVDSERHRCGFPAQLLAEHPRLAVDFLVAESSSALKNLGVAKARGELVAVFEADCVPLPDCLSRLVATLLQYPHISGVSARTVYRGADRSSLRRCLGFMGRGQQQIDRLGEVPFVSSDAQLVRTEVARQFPLQELPSPFISAQRRNVALREAGHRLMYDPQAINIHEFDGVGFELEYRRQKGFQAMERQSSKSLSKVLPLAARNSRRLLGHLRSSGHRELKPLDTPLALTLSLLLPVLEIGGMLDSLRGRDTTGQRFR